MYRASHGEKYQSLHMHSSRKVSVGSVDSISIVDATDASLRQLPVLNMEDSSTHVASILSSDLSEIARLVEEPVTELFSPLRLTSPESVGFATVFQSRSTHEYSHLSKPSNASKRWMRKGFWNRRGDHLTKDGFIVYAPPYQAYPGDLQDYPSESDRYGDEHGNFVDYAVRVEYPDSLPRYGNAPARPYLSVRISHM